MGSSTSLLEKREIDERANEEPAARRGLARAGDAKRAIASTYEYMEQSGWERVMCHAV